MHHTTGQITGQGGMRLFTQHWEPADPPRARIVLAHGVAEHSGRYAHVAARLVAHGYALHALDHRGHGRSGGARLRVRRFDDYVADLRAFAATVRERDPALPFFVYGHSMGALIALLYAARWGEGLAGLVVTGVPLRLGGLNMATLAAIRLLHGARLGRVPLPALVAAGISRDPVVVESYETDPLVCRSRLSVGLVARLVHARDACLRALPDLRMPVLALHGGADPLCLPAGAELLRERCGAPDCTVTVYDGLFHEVHNEPEADRVLDDLLAWLEVHTPG